MLAQPVTTTGRGLEGQRTAHRAAAPGRHKQDAPPFATRRGLCSASGGAQQPDQAALPQLHRARPQLHFHLILRPGTIPHASLSNWSQSGVRLGELGLQEHILPQWQKNPFYSAPDGWGCDCKNGTSPCNVGQACFWFSQGTTIGCKEATGAPSNPNTKSFCNSTMKATVNDPNLRTYNRAAPAGSAKDIYRHNPWRTPRELPLHFCYGALHSLPLRFPGSLCAGAPGSAPVFHPCGMAGGGPHQQPGEAEYTATKIAKQGDLGSVLPYTPTGTVWKRGSIVQTGLSIRANHGGGWQYRLCPLSPNLTESCFQQTPLPFATKHHTLEWDDGSQLQIPAQYVSEGTLPKGSTWVMNPMPYSNSRSPPEFPPPCNETVDRRHSDTGRCSGRDPFDVLVLNDLSVPQNLKPGEYVLGLRWDCEKSAQIWQSCAVRNRTSPPRFR